jgi:hypothetical protein
MVGKRTINRNNSNSAVKESTDLRNDIEEGRPPQDRKYRFRDQGALDPDDQRRVEFKRKLLDAVDGGNLERYRKDDASVCLIPLPFPKLVSSRS